MTNSLQGVTSNRYLFHLTWPIFIELVLQMLVGNADQIMVSQYSTQSVGAIGNANQITNLLIISFSVISMASTILISQYIGSGNREKVEQTYTVSLVLNLMFGLLISLILLFFSKPIFTLMKVPDTLIPETCLYTQIVGGGMVFQAIYLTYTAFFRSNAMMKLTMVVSVIINLLNIGGNYLLINGHGGFPALGVAGAAISSVVSRIIGCILVIIFFRKQTGAKMKISHLRPLPTDLIGKLLRIGLPAGGENISYNLSQICIQAVCNLLPIYVITTRVYANMFANFSYLYASAVAQATQIVVGYLMGARMIQETDRTVKKITTTAVFISLGISTLVYFLCGPLYSLITDDMQIISLAKQICLIEIALEAGRAVNIVMCRTLQAAGDYKFPIFLSLIDVWIVAVGIGYLFSIVLGWGLVGIWIAMAMDECIRAVVLILRWLGGKWRTKDLLHS